MNPRNDNIQVAETSTYKIYFKKSNENSPWPTVRVPGVHCLGERRG